MLRLSVISQLDGSILTTVHAEHGASATGTVPHPFSAADGRLKTRAVLAVLDGDGALGRLSRTEIAWLYDEGLVQAKLRVAPDATAKIGRRLYDCLFCSEPLRRLDSDAPDGALILQLGEDDWRVAQLPWELIHDGRLFRLRGGRASLERRIGDFRPVAPLGPAATPLRVMVIAPRPNDAPPLGDVEPQAIRRVGPRLSVEYLRPPTFNAFKREMQVRRGENLPNVIHFDGHGWFGRLCTSASCRKPNPSDRGLCAACGQPTDVDAQGYLSWEHPVSGNTDYVRGQDMADQIGAGPGGALRLVVLTACQSADVGENVQTVRHAVASHLLAAHVPTVVAIQGEVELTAASGFATAFYSALAVGDEIGRAVGAARTALDERTTEWHRPALFTRCDGAGAPIVTPAAMPQPWPPPRQLDRYIDQEGLIDGVERALLIGSGLLTLTGPGGGGKSRLARELRFDLADTAFRDGIHLVELGGDTTSRGAGAEERRERLLRKLAIKLGLPQATVTAAATFFRGKDALLILDAFDDFRVVADVVEELWAAAPNLSLLITSEARLDAPGLNERERPVPLLSLPPEGASSPEDVAASAAVKLLLVRRSDGPLIVTRQNASTIAEIVRRLDGLPRAIELAAAMLQATTPDELLQELRARGVSLFDGDEDDIDARHRTLTQTLEISFARLNARDQTVLQRLSCFRGGFAREDALAVAADEESAKASVGQALKSLVSRSLVIRISENRFRLLEGARQFAIQRTSLDERTRLEARHRRRFKICADTMKLELQGREQPNAVRWFTANFENLSVAFSGFLAASEVAEAAQLTLALGPYFYIRGLFSEGRRWLSEVLPAAESAAASELAALYDLDAVMRFHQSDLDGALTSLQRAITLAAPSDPATAALATGHLGYVQLLQARRTGGALDAAAASLSSAEDQYAALNDPWGVGWIRGDRGYVALLQGLLAPAQVLLSEALTLRRQSGDLWLEALALHYQGLLAFEQKDDFRAEQRQRECLAIADELGFARGASLAHFALARVLGHRRNMAEGLAQVQAALRIRRELGDVSGQIEALHLAGALARETAPQATARIFATVAAHGEEIPDIAIAPPDEDDTKGELPLELDAAVAEALAL